MAKKYDFGGYATRYGVKCTDGRTISNGAFTHQDKTRVALVWNHEHGDPYDVIGHADLEARADGIYAYGSFNGSPVAKHAKECLEHGDLDSLSIYAKVKESASGEVIHGNIKEVSLVISGANSGAHIDALDITHADGAPYEALIYFNEEVELAHADETEKPEQKEEKPEQKEEKPADENKQPTVKSVQDVIDSMTKEQQDVMNTLIGAALSENAAGEDDDENEEGENSMKHNVFDNNKENTIQHSDADIKAAIADGRRYGSLKESFIQHGIDNMEWLNPEPQTLNTVPEFVSRDMDWVQVVMNSVHTTGFSRVKSLFADITEDDARAKGYIKGKYKKEEVFSLLKRTTTPTTIYKKQKMDRDDILDATEFDVVAWLKGEMKVMLDEEKARAILIGDGRSTSSDDKINEQNIRPIVSDEDFFTIKYAVNVATNATADDISKSMIRGAVKARKLYKGSGQPTLYTTEDALTDALLLEDNNGRRIYTSEDDLAKAMRVSKIVTVPPMEGLKNSDGEDVLGIIVNLKDYNIGRDPRAESGFFEDFDIDYNAMKYLIETRMSGALVKPYSAIVLSLKKAAA